MVGCSKCKSTNCIFLSIQTVLLVGKMFIPDLQKKIPIFLAYLSLLIWPTWTVGWGLVLLVGKKWYVYNRLAKKNRIFFRTLRRPQFLMVQNDNQSYTSHPPEKRYFGLIRIYVLINNDCILFRMTHTHVLRLVLGTQWLLTMCSI